MKIAIDYRMICPAKDPLHTALKLRGKMMDARRCIRRRITDGPIGFGRGDLKHFIGDRHSVSSFSYNSFSLFFARWISLVAAATDNPRSAAVSFAL